MAKKHKVSESDLERLKNQLRERPELFERLSQIIELVEGSGPAPAQSFDEIEERLIPKIRGLGQAGLKSWVEEKGESSQKQKKQQTGTLKSRKKKR